MNIILAEELASKVGNQQLLVVIDLGARLMRQDMGEYTG
jgi:hypothetical protein